MIVWLASSEAALVSSVVASALAWPVNTLSWLVKASWFAALLLSVMSISIAAQQAIMITRVSNQQHSMESMKLLLGMPHSTPGVEQIHWKPAAISVYIWQIPSMVLGNAIVVFVVGLAILLFSNARAATGWGDDQKIAIFFGCFMAFAAFNYCLNWSYLYIYVAEKSSNGY